MPRFHDPSHGNRSNRLFHLDPRVKLIFLLTMLLALAFLRSPSFLQVSSYFLFVLLLAALARLPVVQIAYTSFLVFPFVGFFSLIVYLAGDPPRAWAILAKSYLSALTVLVCAAVTPLPDLMAAAAFFKFPPLLLGVTQIVYRYLFVLSEQVRTMQVAFQARGGRKKRLTFLASSGTVAVLFSRSYQKAVVVNHAMASRGYSGELPQRSFPPFKQGEIGILVLGFGLAVGLQFL